MIGLDMYIIKSGYPISYNILYLYLYLICEMNKKNKMKYILFVMFKINIILHSNIFYWKT